MNRLSMASISDVLSKQLNSIQREKMNEMHSVIEKLQNQLKCIESLAEIRGQLIERLESEKQSLQTN